MKIKTVISLIVIIIMLFLARSMYSNHNLEKIFNACVLGKAKNFSVEEAKKICTEKIKLKTHFSCVSSVSQKTSANFLN